MKTILVDAVETLVDYDGSVNEELKNYLLSLPNKKIVLTNAPYTKFNLYFKNIKGWEIFTLEHNPNKANPEYFKKMFANYSLTKDNVVYFEHSAEAIKSAQSVGIKSYHYDSTKKDLVALKKFLSENL